MRRFFKEDLDGRSARVELAGEEFIHLKKVLRLDRGSAVGVFNGKGLELTGRIEAIGRDSATVAVEGAATGLRESPLTLVLLQALLKGDKTDFIIQKATELGVTEVCFYATPRTVSRVEAVRGEAKLLRWSKVSVEAAKQCGRSVLPRISLAPDLEGAVSGHGEALGLILWEREGAAGLKESLASCGGRKVAALVGPEGGLTPEEGEAALGRGFRKVSLGPRVLRAETAAVAIISILQHAFGDLS